MTQPEQLHLGQLAYLRCQRAAAIARVRCRAWLAAGSKLRQIPAIPSDHDYRIARAAGQQPRRVVRSQRDPPRPPLMTSSEERIF